MNFMIKIYYQVVEFLGLLFFMIVALIGYIIMAFHNKQRATEIVRQVDEAASMVMNTHFRDYTISARLGRAWLKTPRPWYANFFVPAIDSFFFSTKGQKNHCVSEWRDYQKRHGVYDASRSLKQTA